MTANRGVRCLCPAGSRRALTPDVVSGVLVPLSPVDEAARAPGQTRTESIERAVNRALDNFDGVLEEMEADSSLTAAILGALASKRKLALAVTRAVAMQRGAACRPATQTAACRMQRKQPKERGLPPIVVV